MSIRSFTGFGTVTVVALIGSGLSAQDSGPGIAVSGYLELEYLDGTGGEDTLLFGDVSLSIDGALDSAPGLGFDASVVGVSDGDTSEAALYAAATYSFGRSKLSFGVPRSAFGALMETPAFAGSRTLDLALASFDESVTEFAYLLADTDAPIGLRYDGAYGNLDVAASTHRFGDENIDTYAVALRYQVTSNIALVSDWERVLAPAAGGLSTTRVGGEVTYGALEGGLAYFSRDFGAAPHVDGTDIWLTYMPTDRISVTGSAFNTNVFDIYGASLRYDWPVGAYGQVGVADGRSLDTTFDLSIGFEF